MDPGGTSGRLNGKPSPGWAPSYRGFTLIHMLTLPNHQQPLLRGHWGPALKGSSPPGGGRGSFVVSRKTTTDQISRLWVSTSYFQSFLNSCRNRSPGGEVATGLQHKGQEPLRAPPSPTQLPLPGLGAALTLLSRGDSGVCGSLQALGGASLDGSASKDKAPAKSTPETQPRRTKRANKINSPRPSRRQNFHKPKRRCSETFILCENSTLFRSLLLLSLSS